MICIVCGAKDFNVHDGTYYCSECNTQIEQTVDEQTDEVSFSRRALLSSPSSSTKSTSKESATFSDWITFDAYNYILFMQVNALIKLGASPKLKDAVLHIWTKYLGKCEIAFREDYRATENKPRLGPAPAKRDIRVLYGDKQMRSGANNKKGKKKNLYKVKAEQVEFSLGESGDDRSEDGIVSDGGSSIASCSMDNEPKYSSHANKLLRKKKAKLVGVVRKYRAKVFSMTLRKTLSFCYLGLLYSRDQLGLSDLIRFTCGQRIPYTNAADELSDVFDLQLGDTTLFTGKTVPEMGEVHEVAMDLVEFLKLPMFPMPSFHLAVCRFLKDLNLPDDLRPLVNMLFENYKSGLSRHPKPWKSFALEYAPVDLWALSFIVVALKMLFILDGTFEIKHSQVMKKLNSVVPDNNYFVWSEWIKQARLREYLFLAENPVCYSVNKIDSLSADRMIMKYPYSLLKPLSNEEALDIRSEKVSKHEIKRILSSMVNLPTSQEVPPSSFPMRSAISHFEKEWKSMPSFQETKNIDFSFLKKDLTLCSLSYNPLKINEADELTGLITSLYSPKHSRSQDSELEENTESRDTITTTAKYWIFMTSRGRSNASLSTGDWDKNLPATFKWLIHFISKYSSIGFLDLYLQITRIEKMLCFSKLSLRI